MRSSLFTAILLSAALITSKANAQLNRNNWNFQQDRLEQDKTLRAGRQLISPNRSFVFIVQPDGNLVVYNRAAAGCGNLGCSIWSSGTAGRGITDIYMQGDGNLVLRSGGNSIWDTKTGGGRFPPYRLQMQDDGNLVIYNSRRQSVWSSKSGVTNNENTMPTGAEADRIANLRQNEVLLPGESIVSPNGIYSFIVQKDGNLVVYRKTASDNCYPWGCSIWSSNTAGVRFTNLLMQGDGNLVLQNRGRSSWDSRSSTGKYPPYRLQMQDDGNLVIYNARGVSVWSIQSGQTNNE